MQIYVHISGKNYGPYSIDQLREYVSKGSFKSDSQACYDGKNWVTVSHIPGFVKAAEKPKQQTVPAQQKPKKKKVKAKDDTANKPVREVKKRKRVAAKD